MSSTAVQTSTSSSLTGVARGGTFAVIGTGAGSILGFALTLVVTRGLTPTMAGQFFSATAIFIVLQTFLSFGVGAGLVRFVPRFGALGRTNDVPTLLCVAFIPVVVFAFLGSVALWFAAPVLADHVGHDDPTAALGSFRVLALLLLPGTLEVAAVECTRAFGRIRNYVLIQQLGIPAARPLLVGVALWLDSPLWVIVLVWLLPLVAALLLAGMIVGQRLKALFGSRFARPQRTTSVRSIAHEYWAFTGARGVASVMEILLNWLDILLVAVMVSAADAAIYAAASRFITSGTLVLQALRLTIASEVSAALARGDKARVSEMYMTASQWVVLASWPFYLLTAVFAPTVLQIFGPSYSDGATALTILCAAMLVNLAAGNVGTVLLMGGKSTWVLADKGLSLVVNVGANLILVPHLGITGAAIAWAITILLDSSLAFGQVRWGMQIGGSLKGVVLAGFFALAFFGVGGGVVALIAGRSPLTLVLSALVGLLLYIPLALLRREALGIQVLLDALRPRRNSIPTVAG